jgi:hypothetical protein
MDEWPVKASLDQVPTCVICRGIATGWEMVHEDPREFPKGGYSEECPHWYRPFVRLVAGGYEPFLRCASAIGGELTQPPCSTIAEAEAVAEHGSRMLTAKLQMAAAQTIIHLIDNGFSPEQLNHLHVIALRGSPRVSRPSHDHREN